MILDDLLKDIKHTVIKGNTNIEVSDIVYDSRKASEGCVFVCISGETVDGHNYISEVIKKGAVAIVVEKDVTINENVTVISTDSSRKTLGLMSASYFGNPSEQLVTIGLTGTKGKTTTSYMVQSILEEAGDKVGVIGTLGAVIAGEKVKTSNTTPESFEIHKLMKQMVDAGCKYCVMEVSSQGLKMDRTSGITFDYGVFTNFSPDHIGPKEHESLEEYLYCKRLLFKQCKVGIANIDDEKYGEIIKESTCEMKTFGFNNKADLWASDLIFSSEPGKLLVEFNTNGIMSKHIVTEIPGKFSVYNSLVALSLCKLIGISEDTMIMALKKVKVRGRVEIVDVPGDFTIMIDYAHNAMSVESILLTIREYNPKRIVCVYGCGGNRSKLRRYDMGELCGKLADLSILTCDNPRDEEIEEINNDIKVGLKRSNGSFIEILDRKEAIIYSMDNAKPGDIIILLGKGHEDYQEIKGEKHFFSEREIIKEYASDLGTLRAAQL